jgi:hypothetical protein
MEGGNTDIIWVIDRRIHYFQVLLLERLTPHLRDQVHRAITLHSEALDDQPNVNQYLHDLDTSYQQFTEHWTKVYDHPISRARLMQNIALFQQFLAAELLQAYTKERYTVNAWTFEQATIVEQRDSAARIYHTNVVLPLEEMMLNRDHVETKLRAAAARRGHQGTEIQRLIDQCDWVNLAAILTNDQDLALKLFGAPPLDPKYYNADTRTRVLQGINKKKSEYFTELTTPSTFTISTRARDMMNARQVRPITTNKFEERTPTTGFGWHIFEALRTGFTGAGTSGLGERHTSGVQATDTGPQCTARSTFNPDWDETAPLINLKKAE